MQVFGIGRRFALVVLVSMTSIATQRVSAQQMVLHLDPAQTHVGYTLEATMHTVHGTFALKSGEIRYDSASGVASGVVIIDATSGNSGNGSRDQKMHKEILESQKYPEITFTPNRVLGGASQGSSQVQVEGIFRIHGTEHPLTLTVPVQIAGNKLSAATTFVIPYVEWGIKNPSTFFLRVGKTVTIDIKTAGQLSPAR